jgi:hypothetical protein
MYRDIVTKPPMWLSWFKAMAFATLYELWLLGIVHAVE